MPAEGDVIDRLCVILTGGSGALTIPLPRPDLVIAADSGLHLAAAVAGGAVLESHPVDKDATDLDLALEAAGHRGATRTIVVGGAGHDRIDHVLANGGVIAAERHIGVGPEWWVGSARVWPVRGRQTIAGGVGDTVSIIPVGGSVVVSTKGLRWPLHAEPLEFGSSRGVSNQMTGAEATVEIHSGVAMVAHLEEAP